MKRKAAPKTGVKKKILIVDDDPDIITLLGTVLAKAEYEVMKANYSLPALFQVVRDLPDLILVDINMPIMNGLELIEQFKIHQETRNVPIVAITGMDTPEVREEVRRLGCVGFIPKPFDVRRFPVQIAKFLAAEPAKP